MEHDAKMMGKIVKALVRILEAISEGLVIEILLSAITKLL